MDFTSCNSLESNQAPRIAKNMLRSPGMMGSVSPHVSHGMGMGGMGGMEGMEGMDGMEGTESGETGGGIRTTPESKNPPKL